MSIARSEALTIDGLAWPVEIRPHPRARMLRLRLDEARECLTLTCPKRTSRRAALEWARRQSDWVDAQIARLAPSEPFVPGATILVEGREVRLHWDAKAPRTARLVENRLICGGEPASFAARIERHLRSLARERLSEETAAAAKRAGVTVSSVSVGDAGTRWGSCSASGSIRYSWRLVMAPPAILRWVVAHEVAHRLHMNHGPAFRQAEAALFDGDVTVTRAELRALSPRLKRLGRGR